MKNIFKKSVALFLGIAFLTSACSKFDDVNTNPDTPLKVTSGMLATKLILDMSQLPSTKGFLLDDLLCKYLGWFEKNQITQYNKFTRIDDGELSVTTFDDLVVLNNIDKMIEFAPNEKLKNSYMALGHFVRAHRFFSLTMVLGDIPYSEALKSESSQIYKPGYDTQKDVFLGILSELDEANRLFEIGDNFDGDPIYGGNVGKWRKLANTFQLQVLVSLSKRTDDTDLKVKTRFLDILNNRPVFSDNNDNFQLSYSNKANQKYPFYKDGNNFIIYNMVSSFIIDMLKGLNDYRLFYYANPSPVQISSGKSVSDWDAYKGVDVAAEFSVIGKVASSKDFSALNDRYSELPQGEPTFLLSYAQLNFFLAEAIVREWIPGDAKDYYEKGIRAAMKFVADNTPDNLQFNHGMKITDNYIDTYLQSAEVNLSTDKETQIKQIITQEYILGFMQIPYTPYYEYRRTGYPAFPVNPLSNLNVPSDKIPLRWMYPESESKFNSENLNEALQRQYNGNDDVNAAMWILK
jgi:hypothetical protein